MTMQGGSFHSSSDSLEGRFRLRESIAGTLTAKAFRAVDLKSNQDVTLWRTRGPIAQSDAQRFMERLSRLKGVRGVQPILESGIDANGVGFAILLDYRGRKITSRARDREDLQRRFEGCLNLLEELHDRSIACGDLCLDSFILTESGEVSLFAVLGDVSLERQEEEFDQTVYLAFRPAEQCAGSAARPGFDLYALGWLGDSLFTVEVDERSEQSKAPPKWLKNILSATASEDSRASMTSARSLRSFVEAHKNDSEESDSERFALVEVTEGDATKEKVESPSDDLTGAAPKKGDTGRIARQGASDNGKQDDEKTKTGSFKRPRDTLHGLGVSEGLRDVSNVVSAPNRVVLLAFANFLALGVLFFLWLEQDTASLKNAPDPRGPTSQQSSMAQTLRKMYASDAPSVHQELLNILPTTTSPEQRGEVLRTLILRARRMGLSRAADVTLSDLPENAQVAAYGSQGASASVLRVMDPTLAPAKQAEELVKLYESEPRLTAVLAAAMALDQGDVEPYRGILTRAAADQVGILNGGEHSPYALMILLPDVHDLFSEDLVEVSDKIPSSDIAWLLEELGRKGQAEVSTVAQLAYNRRVVTGLHAIFLKELYRGVALPESVRSALVSGALDKLSDGDIRTFGEWYGQGAPRVLEAGIITANDSGIREAAFESLSSKPIHDVYVARVLEFIRNAYTEESPKYGGVVAVLALRDVVDETTMNRELDKVKNAPRKRELVKQLIKGAPAEVLVLLITLHGESVEALDLVDLLSHPSTQVRRSAVMRLSSENDIMVQKLISQSYDEEKDSEIRALYEAHVPVIQNRNRPPL